MFLHFSLSEMKQTPSEARLQLKMMSVKIVLSWAPFPHTIMHIIDPVLVPVPK